MSTLLLKSSRGLMRSRSGVYMTINAAASLSSSRSTTTLNVGPPYLGRGIPCYAHFAPKPACRALACGA